MYKKQSKTNPHRYSKYRRKTASSQKSTTMGKYSLTKRRHSQQSKLLRSQQETTLIWNKIEHVNSTTRLKHRTNTLFRPLAASTPYNIEQSNTFNDASPHSIMRHQRLVFTPPICCSTPKQIHRQLPNNNSHGRSTSSSKQNPSIPMISQRRLQFIPDSPSFVRYLNDDTKQMNIKKIKIWLL